MRYLVTGAAGFIGFHTSLRLLDQGHEVIGIDNLNAYYDVKLKEARLAELKRHAEFQFHKIDIEERAGVEAIFTSSAPRRVIHLAAQAGVRYSTENPHAYVASNVVGTLNILEGCRHNGVEHLIFASTSSVYGANTSLPFSVSDNVDHPLSLYAATKKSTELMAHSYAHLYGLSVSGLRFFTVYGPWGRPDMALYTFTRSILAGEPIDVYNNGNHARDFTYIDDIVEGIVRVADKVAVPNSDWSGARPDPATSLAPYRIYNIGNNAPVALMDYIGALEAALGKTAKKNFLPMQAGDVPATYADITALEEAVGFRPATPIEEGIRRFVDWYRAYHGV